MFFVFIWEQTATCATYSITWLVFITAMKSVYSAVRTSSLNKAVCASSLKGKTSSKSVLGIHGAGCFWPCVKYPCLIRLNIKDSKLCFTNIRHTEQHQNFRQHIWHELVYIWFDPIWCHWRQKILHRIIASLPLFQSALNFFVNRILIWYSLSQIFELFHPCKETIINFHTVTLSCILISRHDHVLCITSNFF